jgi:hypothetical protein
MNWKMAGCAAFLAMIACGQSPGGPGQPDAGPRVMRDPIDVSGRVVDAFSWAVGGATVVISGHPPVVTDQAGGFKIDSVSVPYDVTVIDRDSEGRPLVLVHVGLTRTDPTLTTMPQHLHTASINGRVLGADLTRSSAAVAFSSANAMAASVPVSSDGSFAFSGRNSVTWSHENPTVGTLHALQWQTSDSRPITYSYGRKNDVSLAAGTSLVGQEVRLTSVGLDELHGTINGPARVQDVSLYVSFDSDSLLPVLVDSSSEHEFRYKVPNIPDGTCFIVVRAQFAGGLITSRQGGDCRGEWTFQLSASAPELVNPPDGFSGLTNETELRWTHVARLYEVDLVPEDSALPLYVLRTPEQKIKLPDLSQVGLSLPRSASYRWQVRSDYAWGAIDDFASSLGTLLVKEIITKKFLFELPQIEYVQLDSSVRRLTTGQ